MGACVSMYACVLQVMEYLNKAEKERSDKEKRKMGPRHTAKKTTLTEGAEGTGTAGAGQLQSQEELQRLKSALTGSQANQSLEATAAANRVVEGRVGKAAATGGTAAGTVGKAGKTTKTSPSVAASATAAATTEGSLILSASGSGTGSAHGSVYESLGGHGSGHGSESGPGPGIG